MDAAKDGMADWLADLVTGETSSPPSVRHDAKPEGSGAQDVADGYRLDHFPAFDVSAHDAVKLYVASRLFPFLPTRRTASIY